MMFRIYLSAFICLAAGALPVLANEAIEGMYVGTISPATPADAVTTFKVTSTGKVFGIYFFNDENGKKSQGKLDGCELSGRVLQCHWRDKYGKGDWRVKFSKDYKRFNGRWYEKVGDLNRLGPKGGYKWSGEQVFD